MGGNSIGSRRAAANRAKAFVGACLVVAVSMTAATPALAKARRHRVVVPTTLPFTTTTFPVTTTTSTMPAPVAPAPAPIDACGKGAWPSQVQGRPLYYQAGDGVYLWDDPDGSWAVRATHTGPTDKTVISGTLTTTGKFTWVRREKGTNEIVAVSPNKKKILFRFVRYGWVAGFDFDTHCSQSVSASFYVGGSLASPTAVHIGSVAANPVSNPFKVQRGKAAVLSTDVKALASLGVAF